MDFFYIFYRHATDYSIYLIASTYFCGVNLHFPTKLRLYDINSLISGEPLDKLKLYEGRILLIFELNNTLYLAT